MAIVMLNSVDCLAAIAASKAKGFVPSSFEVELIEGEYEGTSNGLYKSIEYSNAKGKGLIIFAVVDVEVDDKIQSVDIPIKESLVGMWNEGDAVTFEVFRKDNDSANPKRVKLVVSNEDTNVNSVNPRIAELEDLILAEKNATKKAALKKELLALS